MTEKSEKPSNLNAVTQNTPIEIDGQSRQFIKLLGDETQYSSVKKIIHSPSVSDSIAHLKLLNAFHKLRQIITVNINTKAQQGKLWQCYVTMAVRKFNIFISALKIRFPNDHECESDFNQFMNNCLPSLDILLVWHAFLLNPRSIHDNFLCNDFLNFVKFPFPLYRIDQEISNETLMYQPSQAAQSSFMILMDEYLVKIDSIERFSYDVYQPFDPFQIYLPVMCPICFCCLGIHPLTSSDHAGFADLAFKLKSKTNCECGFKSAVNFEQLRRRKLVADSQKNSLIPSIHKYYSPEITKKPPKEIDVKLIDTDIKNFVLSTLDAEIRSLKLASLLEKHAGKRLNRFSLLVLRDYFESNPVYLTVPTATSIPIQEDLVACVTRQERFIDKMVDLNWLFSSYVGLTIDEAIERYHRFFQLMRSSKHPIVPTLDIDLI